MVVGDVSKSRTQTDGSGARVLRLAVGTVAAEEMLLLFLLPPV